MDPEPPLSWTLFAIVMGLAAMVGGVVARVALNINDRRIERGSHVEGQ